MLRRSQLNNPDARWVVLEEDIVPIKRGEFISFFDACDYIEENEKDGCLLYIVEAAE